MKEAEVPQPYYARFEAREGGAAASDKKRKNAIWAGVIVVVLSLVGALIYLKVHQNQQVIYVEVQPTTEGLAAATTVPPTLRRLADYPATGGSTVAPGATAAPPPDQPNPNNLTASEIEFITKVRMAGLWEAPSGQQAQQRAGSERVKEVGRMIASDHIKLDGLVRSIATKLGVVLPSTPSDEQLGWMKELSGVTGEAYDRTFANRLRAAHGKVLILVATVRSTTTNADIRQFAEVAVDVVMSHMRFLESTGFVDFNAL